MHVKARGVMRWFWLSPVALFAACGGVQRAPSAEAVPSAEIVFEETLITRESDGDVGTRTVGEVFEEANDYLRADDTANAIRLYTFLIETFSDASYVRTAHYNLGLALEKERRFDEALEHYEHIVATWLGSDDATWAHFRIAECQSQLGRYEAIPALMEAVLPRSGLHLIDRIEAHLRWGNALLELRQYAEADMHLQEAIELNERARMRWRPGDDVADEPLQEDHAMLAQAHFSRGRIYHELFLEIRLVLPEERLTRDLIDKGQLFEQAQEAYLDGVRTGHRYWSTAAGFMIGQLYEDFYYDVLACEIPTSFNELELEIYFEELRAYLEPAMERAMGIYENNLAMAYRIGSENEWVDDTLTSIDRVQRYLVDHEQWDIEQQLVIERMHPRSAFFADQMVFRTELREATE